MKKSLMTALCVLSLFGQHTASAQDVLEVNFPKDAEGFVEVKYGILDARHDTLPIVNGKLVIEKNKEELPVTVALKYLEKRDANNLRWLAVKNENASTRRGDFPIGYGRTVITFDTLSLSSPVASVGTIVDEYGDFEALDTYSHARQRFRSEEFLKAHSHSLEALHLLSHSWDADTLQMALNCFTESLRNSERGKELQQLIWDRKNKKGVIKLFPMWDTAGKAHSFDECLNGKDYMLLNLWASWCGPCRAEIPELIAYYEECRERVAFVSVTVDENQEDWLKAVNEVPKYEWHNLSSKFDGTPKGRPLPLLFDPGYIPFFFIIDRNGNTVYSSLEQQNDDEKPLDDAKRRLNELLEQY